MRLHRTPQRGHRLALVAGSSKTAPRRPHCPLGFRPGHTTALSPAAERLGRHRIAADAAPLCTGFRRRREPGFARFRCEGDHLMAARSNVVPRQHRAALTSAPFRSAQRSLDGAGISGSGAVERSRVSVYRFRARTFGAPRNDGNSANAAHASDLIRGCQDPLRCGCSGKSACCERCPDPLRPSGTRARLD